MRAWAAVVVLLALGCNGERRPGNAESSFVIAEGDGGALLLIDRIRWDRKSTRTRLTSIDLVTGKETGLRLVGSSDFACVAAGAPGKIGGERVRIDPASLEVTVDSTYTETRDTPMGGRTCHINEIWLADARTGEPIEIDGDRLMLDEDREGKWRVLRGGLGESVGVAPLAGECETATRVGDVVVIATKSAKQRAVGIDAATGAIRWSYGF